MSRVGKQPIPLPGSVKAEISGQTVKVTGPKGSLDWTVPEPIEVRDEDGALVCTRPNDERRSKAFHGLSRALLANMVKGVAEGYEIKLEAYGTGYSAKLQGKTLLLNLGYMGRGVGRTAQFEIPIPAGIEVKIETEVARGNNDPARFSVVGIDKQQVGQFAAEIRKLRKPEPYLGKGVRYGGEQIRRKAGKVFAGGG